MRFLIDDLNRNSQFDNRKLPRGISSVGQSIPTLGREGQVSDPGMFFDKRYWGISSVGQSIPTFGREGQVSNPGMFFEKVQTGN